MVPPLPQDRFYSEFYDALQDGFGNGRRTRVLLLSRDFGFWRLTPERARIALEKSEWSDFMLKYAGGAWIEIDTAHDWLRGWLDDSTFRDWVSYPPIKRALEAAAKAQPIWRAPIFGSTARSTQPTGGDDHDGSSDLPAIPASAAASANTGVKTTGQQKAQLACVEWLASFARQGLAAPGRNREARIEEARRAVGPLLTGRGFDDAWTIVKDRYPDIQSLWLRPGPKAGAKGGNP